MFETDKYGQVTIKTNPYQYHMNDGYVPISHAQFDKAWRALKTKIAGIKP
jgi:hypothetical protein